jgi:hypothetical protein
MIQAQLCQKRAVHEVFGRLEAHRLVRRDGMIFIILSIYSDRLNSKLACRRDDSDCDFSSASISIHGFVEQQPRASTYLLATRSRLILGTDSMVKDT